LRRILAAGAAAAVLAAARHAAAQQLSFVVVVHPSNTVPSLTRQQVADLFLKRTSTWPGGREAHPIDLPARSRAREGFSTVILGRPVQAVTAYWNQQIFAGRGTPPPQGADDAAVAEFIRNDPDAIGYLPAGAVPPDLRILRVTL
jgi:ABC-type phosphate transport system substrate-binding protein